MCRVALPCCLLTLLASFFLPSHLSLKHVHAHIHLYACTYTCIHAHTPVYIHAHTGELLPIRLRDGPSDQEGRVEVYYNGTWGTICDDFWDLRDATVACRQLGFVEAITAESFAHFGSGIGE